MTLRPGTHNTDQHHLVTYCDGPGCGESTVSEWPNSWMYLGRGVGFGRYRNDAYHFHQMPCLTMWAAWEIMGGQPSKEVVLWTPKHLSLRLWWQLSNHAGGGPFTDPLALMLSPVAVHITSRGGESSRTTRTARQLSRARVAGGPETLPTGS